MDDMILGIVFRLLAMGVTGAIMLWILSSLLPWEPMPTPRQPSDSRPRTKTRKTKRPAHLPDY